ncbi:MAG TPA: GNAT family N-acetyltransferase [Bacillales bacterium]|nr:GNAT family N-acetyltransferase [Bacillales bacterium]
MHIRHVEVLDYNYIHSVINDWWGGRKMSDMLPKLFFVHFRDTSFVAEENGQVIGFVIGFISQTFPSEAYIHFVGVDPAYRKQDIGRKLYEIFIKTVRKKHCQTIRCITSPVNQKSIAFHTKLGFAIEPGDAKVDGVSVTKNYDGAGGDRVRFRKDL